MEHGECCCERRVRLYDGLCSLTFPLLLVVAISVCDKQWSILWDTGDRQVWIGGESGRWPDARRVRLRLADKVDACRNQNNRREGGQDLRAEMCVNIYSDASGRTLSSLAVLDDDALFQAR